MRVYGSDDFETQAKSDLTPLTLADRLSNEAIVSGLERIEPGTPVLSEESDQVAYETRRAWRRFWLVDPLDGTKEFVNRNDEFTVNIALVEDGRPVLGVVYAPAIDACYAALAGGDVERADGSGTVPIRCSDYRRDGLRVVASRSHAGSLMPAFLHELGDPQTRSRGSALKFCLVAEGDANLYPRFGPTMEWDVAAAECIVVAAGGSITDLAGRPLAYNKPDLRNPSFVACGSPAYAWKRALDAAAIATAGSC